MQRSRKKSCYWYKKVIESNGADLDGKKNRKIDLWGSLSTLVH